MAFDESLLEPIDDFDESLLESLPEDQGYEKVMPGDEMPLPSEQREATIGPSPGLNIPPLVNLFPQYQVAKALAGEQKLRDLYTSLRTSPIAENILGPVGEGAKTAYPTVPQIGERMLEFTSLPPPLRAPVSKAMETFTEYTPQYQLAKQLLGEEIPSGIKSGLTEFATTTPIAPIAGKIPMIGFGAQFAGSLPEAREQYREAVRTGDVATAAKIGTQVAAGAGLLALGGAHEAIGRAKATPVDGVKDMLANPPEEGLSDKAFALGKQVKTVDEVKDLLRLREQNVRDSMKEFADRMEEINKLPPEQRVAAMESPDMVEVQRKSQMGTQIVNEALEKATGFNVTKNKPGETFPVPLTPEQFSKLEAEVKAETQPKVAPEVAPEVAPKEEAVTPAAPAESENVHVQNAKQVEDMTSRTQFSIWSNQQREGASGAAQTVGWNAPTAEFRDYLKQQWDNSVATQRDKTKSSSERELNRNKAQFFREAYEVATGTGSAEPGSLFRRKNPSYKPPFPLTETEKGPVYAKDKEQTPSGVPAEQGKPAITETKSEVEAGTALGSRPSGQERPTEPEVLLRDQLSASGEDVPLEKLRKGDREYGQIVDKFNRETSAARLKDSIVADIQSWIKRNPNDPWVSIRTRTLVNEGLRKGDPEILFKLTHELDTILGITANKSPQNIETKRLGEKVFRTQPELDQAYQQFRDLLNTDYKGKLDIFTTSELHKLGYDRPKDVLSDWADQRTFVYEKNPGLARLIDDRVPGPWQTRRNIKGIAPIPIDDLYGPSIKQEFPETEVKQPVREVSLSTQLAVGIPDPVTTAKAATKIITDFVSSATPGLKTIAASLQGRAVPRTSSASTASGNALVRLASAKIAAPAVARSMATDVLGAHHKDTAFSQKLGAVLVEDRLRAIRSGLQQAGDPDSALVQSIIGQQWSPLKTEADYRVALADPEIKAAIDRHKATVQQRAEEAHVMARGELAGVGQDTGAFVNLKAILPEAEAEVLTQGGRGNLENPLRRLSRFFREAKGTGQKYELDYRTLAERMIRGNFEEVAKRQLYDQLIRDGLAIETDPGVKPPEIGGKPSVGFTIERRGVPAGENRARTFIKKLWIRQDLAREFRQADDLDGPVSRAGLVTAVNLINRIQLAGPTDAVWHTANMIGSIAGSQGGRTVLTDLARKLPGVNLADAIVRTTARGIRLMRDDPAIQRQMAELAELGAMRAPHDANFMGRFIQFIDRAGRLVRDDMYQNLVRRGALTASEAERREWVNQMGQYNPRLMSQYQRFFKEFGFSPFVVAGRNFNRMAMRRLFMQPGIEAANKTEALKLRAIEAFGTFATLVVVPSLINYATTGSPSGRPGTKFGVIDTGKNDKDGNAIVIDPAQWTGLRRGMRISGVQAFIEGQRRGQSGNQIARTALRDELGGILHPWTGPPVTAATVGATGYDPRFYKQSEDPSNPAENLKASLQQLNPIAKAIITSHEKDTPVLPKTLGEAGEKTGKAVAEIGKSFGGAVGVKPQKLATSKDQLTDLHQAWMRTNPNKKIQADYERRQKEQFVSDYKDLDTAMRKGDEAAAMRAITALLETKSPKDIAERMSPFYKESPAHVEGTKKPLFQESLATEGKFYRTLNDEQKKLYHQAQKDRIERYNQFLGYLRQVMGQRKPDQPQRPIPQPYA